MAISVTSKILIGTSTIYFTSVREAMIAISCGLTTAQLFSILTDYLEEEWAWKMVLWLLNLFYWG